MCYIKDSKSEKTIPPINKKKVYIIKAIKKKKVR